MDKTDDGGIGGSGTTGGNDNDCVGGSDLVAGNVQFGGIMAEGQAFVDAEQFRRVLKSHAIATKRSFTYKKNERERVVVVCSDKECSWKIRASLHKSDGSFGIRTCNLNHTCGADNLKQRGHPKADANWIAGLIKEKLRGEPNYATRSAMNDIHRALGVEVPYHRAWLGKEIALREINGDDRQSFDKLRWYCSALLKQILAARLIWRYILPP